MNYNFNTLRAISIMSIAYIHTISFIVPFSSLNGIEKYFYSFFSLSVPLLFMLSGFLFAKSKNQANRIKSTLKIYFKFCVITILFNYFVFHQNFDIYKLILFNQSSIGYLWFVKILIYCQLIIYFAKNNKEYLLTIILIFFISNPINELLQIIFYFICYFTGYIISIKPLKIYQYVPTALIFYTIFMPVILKLKYYTNSPTLYIFSTLVFLSILNVKSNRKVQFLEFFSKNSLEILFMQYFVIESLLRLKYTFVNLWLTFILVSIIIYLLVYIYAIIGAKIREEQLKY